jgi:TRAP-type C4-dicarboxylate transport system permease small subunit
MLARGITRLADAFCQAAFAGVFVVFLYKIAMRYLAGDAVAWADEVSVVLFVWIIFVANAALLDDRAQIRFDLIERHAGPGGRRIMAVARLLLIGSIFAVSLPASLDYIAFLWRERTPVLLWRLDVVYACFGLFMAGQIIRMACRLWQLVRPGWRDAL